MDQRAVNDVVAPVAEGRGLEIDRLEFAAAGKRTIVRIYLDGDGPAGRGPSLDEIADATRAISIALDESGAAGDAPYVLEVSSRGVSRPLTEERHFRRNTGRLVAFTLAEGEKLTARIASVGPDGVSVESDGDTRVLPLAVITKAVVQVEMNRSESEASADDEEDLADDEDDWDDEGESDDMARDEQE